MHRIFNQRMDIMNSTLKKSAQLLSLLFSVGILSTLQGCGAERDTPFNPDTSEEDAVIVDSDPIKSGNKDNANVLDFDNKLLQVITNEDDYFEMIDKYTDNRPTAPNFNNGQVVFIDLGEKDSCENYLTLSELIAQEEGDNGVKVVIDYNEHSKNTGDCTSTITRPYHIYYIDSTGPLVFEENIN